MGAELRREAAWGKRIFDLVAAAPITAPTRMRSANVRACQSKGAIPAASSGSTRSARTSRA